MTKKDIINWDLKNKKKLTFNEAYLNEGYSHSEKRLIDILSTKKILDQKAFFFLSYGLVMGLSFFLIANSILKYNKLLFFLSCFCSVGMILSSIFFSFSLKSLHYGSLGEYPTNWIKKNAPSKKSFLMCSIFDLKIRIDYSLKSNIKKSIFIDYGIIIFLISLCLFILSILCHFDAIWEGFLCH